MLAVAMALPGVAGAQTDPEKGIAWFRESDPAMNGAIRKARDTLPVFRKYLSHPSTDVTSIQLKVRLTQGDENEHVWLADVAIQNDGFVGTITNRIEYVSGYKLGERIKVRPGSVSDWMVVTTKGIRGAYSLQVILAREKPADPHDLIGDLADLPFLDH
ncbi:DUF2314 domain-containing protein [Inquilinus sp. CA228]|uniref:DUF2314 domain-containing protein n=1 Tax=Inquilinus sp. CA228 TaxID=3455609 RepID=UPI003F8D8DA3